MTLRQNVKRLNALSCTFRHIMNYAYVIVLHVCCLIPRDAKLHTRSYSVCSSQNKHISYDRSDIFQFKEIDLNNLHDIKIFSEAVP
jgi:hypothetical protein